MPKSNNKFIPMQNKSVIVHVCFVLFIVCLYICVCEYLIQNNKHKTKHQSNTNCGSVLEPGASRLPWEQSFLLKTDSGYPKDTGVNKTWQPLRIPSAITSIGQLHQSPPSPIPGDLGRGPSHQSHVLEHRDTYGQARICSKGHQGSSVDRPCQPSFYWIKFWHGRNPLPQSIRLRLSVLVRYWAGQGEWSLSWTKKKPTHLSLLYDYCLATQHP